MSSSTDEKSGSNGVAPSSMDKMQDLFGKIQPLIEKLIDLYAFLSPHIETGKKYMKMGWKKVEPYYEKYWSDEFIDIFIGFTLLFFGGQFAMTIACYMAIQISGWDTMKKSWRIIKDNYHEGMEAFEKDPNAKKFFDKDGDGNISASEMGQAAKMIFSGTPEQKKGVLLNLRCVFVAIDPQEVMNAIGGFWATAIAVIATLRSGFAKDIALGVSLGNIVSLQVSKYVKPMIAKRVDDDMKKWVDFLIESICRVFGISLALILVRIVSAFHSAVKGGQMIALHILKFLNNKQLYIQPSSQTKQNVQSTTFFMALQYGLAITGFWWQLSSGFALNSIFLRLILLPFSICEWILTFLAAY